MYGDAAGLSRAVLNLLDNAAKWSPPNGRVGVRLTQIDPVHAELVVSDYGPGIPPHERQLVFERFFRSTAARAMPGSGLGLAIVKQVVLKHGGALRVEDTVRGGQPPGTSIYVLLPGRVDSRDTARGSRTTGGQRRQWVKARKRPPGSLGMCRRISKWILSPSGHREDAELRCRSVGVARTREMSP